MSKREQNWEERICQLQAYKEKYGDVNVRPASNDDNAVAYQQLFAWLTVQRSEWKKALARQKTTMTLERIERLTALGVTLHKTAAQHHATVIKNRRAKKEQHGRAWETNFTNLREYQRRYQTLDVPLHDEQHRSLHFWLKKQRDELSRSERGQQTHLTSVQLQRLTNLGVKSSIPATSTEKWQKALQELQSFKEVHGHVRVPSTEKKYASLYKWLIRQKVSQSHFRRSSIS